MIYKRKPKRIIFDDILSFVHPIAGFIAFYFPIVIIFFAIYQLMEVGFKIEKPEHTIGDFIEFSIGYFIAYIFDYFWKTI